MRCGQLLDLTYVYDFVTTGVPRTAIEEPHIIDTRKSEVLLCGNTIWQGSVWLTEMQLET
jgi:hypothetical protein